MKTEKVFVKSHLRRNLGGSKKKYSRVKSYYRTSEVMTIDDLVPTALAFVTVVIGMTIGSEIKKELDRIALREKIKRLVENLFCAFLVIFMIVVVILLSGHW